MKLSLLPCPECDGTGRVDVSPEVLWHAWAPCFECKGSGGAMCDTCWEPHATHYADGRAECDACRRESLVANDTIPCPPPAPEQDDEAHVVAGLEASLAVIASAREAQVPAAAALKIGRDALARMAGRR